MILTPNIFADATTFILGNEKNAGKTTLLNYLVRRLRERGSLAYLSVGVDGEGTDLISGGAKPNVVAAPGDWLVTAAHALRQSDIAAEIHEVFPFGTAMGPSVLVRVVRGGFVELIGPGTNQQLSHVLQYVTSGAGVRTVLVDGAINRITQVGASAASSYVYVLRANRVNLARTVDSMRLMSRLGSMPVLTGQPPTDANAAVLAGALTSGKAQALDTACRMVVVQDFSHVFLSSAELASLLRRASLHFREQFHCRAFVVNLIDVSRGEFLDALADPSIAEKVAFNPYQEVA